MLKLAALRANYHQSKDWYAVVTMRISDIVECFPLTDNSELPVADRTQRRLQKNRLPQIARYMVKNADSYLFPSLIIGVQHMKFEPVKAPGADTGNLGILSVNFDKMTLIVDGQHRIGGFSKAIAEAAALGKDEITLLIVLYKHVSDAQRMFSDTNRFTKATPIGLNIAFGAAPLDVVTRNVINAVPVFDHGRLVEQERGGSLSIKSAKLASNVAINAALDAFLGAIQSANRATWANDPFKGVDSDDTDQIIKVQTRLGVDLFTYLSSLMPPWIQVSRGTLQAPRLRETVIHSHAVAIRAMGAVAGRAYVHCGESKAVDACYKKLLAPLSAVNWNRTNPDFIKLGIVRVDDEKSSVRSDRQAKDNMVTYLLEQLQLTVLPTAPRKTAVLAQDSNVPRLKRAVRVQPTGAPRRARTAA